jgi:hypothetical protein
MDRQQRRVPPTQQRKKSHLPKQGAMTKKVSFKKYSCMGNQVICLKQTSIGYFREECH